MQTGSEIGVWTGSLTDSAARVAVLAVVATKGYHSICKYTWKKNKQELKGEMYPVLYTTCAGMYQCTANIMDRAATITFKVTGEIYRKYMWFIL